MHRFCSLGFVVQEAETAAVGAISAATLYGKGVFTTIRIRRGEPFLWEKHWRRLSSDAEKVGIDISSVSEIRLQAALKELLAANQVTEARARITLFDSSGGGMWETGRLHLPPKILITTAPRRALPPTLRLTISPFSVNSGSPLAGIKSCNYLENLMAFNEANRRGFDEAIRPNEKGEIVSAAMANIFWFCGNELFTPPVSSGCIAGTTREYIVEKVGAVEANLRPEDLKNAERIFIASSGIGIAEVAEVDETRFRVGNHPLVELLAEIEEC